MNSKMSWAESTVVIKRSKYEDRVAKFLDKAGVPYEYEAFSYQYTEPLRKNSASCKVCGSTSLTRKGWYTPDFFLGNGCIIETKGRFDAADRRKMKAMKEQYPNEEIVLLFMRDNKLSKLSKTYYSDWCMDNGYDFDIGMPPPRWLKEIYDE